MTIPAPPAGGHDKLRLLRVPAGQVWYRISHRRHGSALHFSKGPDARWAFEAPAAPDGIRYPPRPLPGRDNTALFDLCRDALKEEDLGPLASWQSDTEDLDIFDILDAQGWGLV